MNIVNIILGIALVWIPAVAAMIGLFIGYKIDGASPHVATVCFVSLGFILGVLGSVFLDSRLIETEIIQIQEYNHTDNCVTYVDLSGKTGKITCDNIYNNIKVEQTNDDFSSIKVTKSKTSMAVKEIIVYETAKDNNNINVNEKLKCNNCNNEDISENDNFCSECGNKVN